MSKKAQPKDLQKTVEQELAKMLASKDEPSEGRMKLLKTAIGFLAVQAKLEESEYGGFFGDTDPTSIPSKQRAEPATREPEDDGSGGGFFPEGQSSGLPS